MSNAICSPAYAFFNRLNVHVLAVDRGPRSFILTVETAPELVGSPSCGVLAAGHGRRQVMLHELAAPRGKFTTRAIAWAVAQLRRYDIAVSAQVDMLGVAWNAFWDAIALVNEG